MYYYVLYVSGRVTEQLAPSTGGVEICAIFLGQLKHWMQSKSIATFNFILHEKF